MNNTPIEKQIEFAKKVLKNGTCFHPDTEGCIECPAHGVGQSCIDIKGGYFEGNGETERLKCLQWFRNWLSENDKEEEVKNYVDWGKIPKQFGYVAVQPSKSVMMFPAEPNHDPHSKSGDYRWWYNHHDTICAENISAGAIIGPLPQWDKSLIKRPEVQEEIIGWPGNKEEMRQYIGRNCILCDNIAFVNHSDEGALEIGGDDEEMPYSNPICGYFRYCKILPGPAIIHITKDEAISAYAELNNVPVEFIRIRD